MFTVCPKCTLTLAVTVKDLRAGQGYVRCGRCANVFNALLTLSEQPPEAMPLASAGARAQTAVSATPGEAAPSPLTQPGTASSLEVDQILMLGGNSFPRPQTALGAYAPLPQQDAPLDEDPSIALEEVQVERGDVTDQFELSQWSGEPTPPSELATETATATATAISSAHHPAGPSVADEPHASRTSRDETPRDSADSQTVETIVLEGDGFTQTEEVLTATGQGGFEALRREIETLGNHTNAPTAGVSDDSPADVAVIAAGAPGPSSDPEVTHAALESALASFARRAPAHLWAWLSGSLALALLLALQAINHWRDALAASPSFGALVTHGYARLGVTLEPHWDLNGYEVRQQGAESDPSDAHVIRVRLSLANHAARAQPVPVLRLTLLDRYGKRLARRDLAPAEYWPRGRARQSFLASDQRIDSEVAVRDPNADSASFELDVCLTAQQRIQCAGDTAATTANLLTP